MDSEELDALEVLFRASDKNGDGVVDFNEFKEVKEVVEKKLRAKEDELARAIQKHELEANKMERKFLEEKNRMRHEQWGKAMVGSVSSTRRVEFRKRESCIMFMDPMEMRKRNSKVEMILLKQGQRGVRKRATHFLSSIGL